MTDKSIHLGAQEERPLEAIRPYPNNPRNITDEAVSAVKESLERFGWQQPIVVDKDGVIVVGHTRYRAATELGMERVPVVVMEGSAEAVNAYRIADNRTSEFAQWDDSKLAVELREFDENLLSTYFPEVDLDLEIEQIEQGVGEVTQAEIDRAEEHLSAVAPKAEILRHTTDVECPSCSGVFQVLTKTLPGVNEKLLKELTGD